MKNTYSEEDMVLTNIAMWVIILGIVIYMTYALYK